MGDIFSSHIFQENDEVKIVALAFGEEEKKIFNVSSGNAFTVRNELRKMKKAMKKDFDSEGHQVYIKTEQAEEWIPVDHFYWKDGDYKVGIEFTGYGCYVKKNGYWQDFKDKANALGRLSNLIWKP